MKNGFTLIELLIALAILAAVTTAGFVGLSRYKGGRDIELTMSEVVSAVREVQKRSITEKDGKRWGIRFSNASSSYEIFSGASYSTSTVDRLYPLSRNIIFGNPSTSTVDTIFSAISGKLSENRIISLRNQRRDGLVGDITLTSRGTITNRLENGIVGYWHLDEATSTKVYDSSGFTNTGTLTNGPIWTSASGCKAGQCLDFDGTDDYVDAGSGSTLDITQTITLGAWVKLDTYTSGGTNTDRASIVQKTGQYYMTVNSTNGTLDAFFGGVTGSHTPSNSTVPLNQWAHTAITYDGSNIKWYINGVLDKTSAATGTITSDPRSVRIGGEPGFGRFLNGSIDEVRIYNRALSATEIKAMYDDLK